MKTLFVLLSSFLLTLTATSQSCLPEGISFTTQSQIDNFTLNYPGCTQIAGWVMISGNDIYNLEGISVLTSIGGELRISETSNLSGLSGFENLISVGLDLKIHSNSILASLTGLQNLVTVGGNVEIIGNNLLMSISALSGLQKESVADLVIHDNGILEECDVEGICDYLSEPNGHVDIYNNASGCKSPPDIAAHCGITLTCLPHGDYYLQSQADVDNFANDYSGCTSMEGLVIISGENISNLNGLSNITSMGMYSKIEGNDILENLQGLEALTVVSGSLSISYNDALVSLMGLENLSAIDGNLSILGNYSLTDLDGFVNLEYLGSWLEIGYNNNLNDITALSKISSIGEMLWVGYNESLTSLSGLENIDHESFNMLFLIFNPAMTDCDVLSICDFLAAQEGIIQITDNATGCNNQLEILAECEVGMENLMKPEQQVQIYPNPASDMLFIESTEKIESIIIFDSRGITLEHWNNGTLEQWNGGTVRIPVSRLVPGLYLVRIETGGEMGVRKVVIRR